MRTLLVAMCLLAGCSKSTCDKAVARMIECKMIVGNLLPKQSGEVYLEQANGRLKGACDVAVEANEADRKKMECAAEASSCDELARCAGE